MPCYLFTYHAYLSWLPDRPQGYVERGQGILPPDPEKADAYRRKATEPAVIFDERIQHFLITETQNAAEFQRFEVHAIGSDSTHLHLLVAWRDKRSWDKLRNGIKESLTRRLNLELGRRKWFVANASRKRVRDREHFDYLRQVYLPDHRGLKWDCKRGIYC